MEQAKEKAKGTPLQKKIICETVAVILGVIVALIPAPEGLTPQAMQAIGLLVWAVVNWVTMIFPDYTVVLMMCCAWVVLKIVPFNTAFGAFSGSTIWLVIGVLGISVGVSKSGLLKRAALMVMRIFPPTFKGQVLALLGSGYVVAPLIPSTVAKATITAPIARGIGETLGYEKKSKGMTGLFVAMYSGFVLTAPVFISASFFGYIALGLMPEALQKTFTWGHWLLCMLPYGIILGLGCYLAIIKMYKPEQEIVLPKDEVRKQLETLGPMSRNEKITLGILVVAICFWIAESYSGIPAVVPAVLGITVLILTGIVTTAEFHSKISWSMIIFIGGILSLADVLTKLGINDWIGKTITPYISIFTNNPYLFVVVVAVLMYLLRFVIVSMGAAISIFTVIMAPIAVAAGYSPWIPAIVGYCSVTVWNLKYQNSNFAAVFAAMGGEDVVEYHKTVKMSVAYMLVNIVALLVSVPYWKLFGLIP